MVQLRYTKKHYSWENNILVLRERKYCYQTIATGCSSELYQYWRSKYTSKAELHEKKIIPFVWWDWKGVVFFELLPRNQTINSDVYCRQLNKLNAAVKEKGPELVNRKGAIFHHDNATPHTSLAIRQKLVQFFADKDQKFYKRGVMKLPER